MPSATPSSDGLMRFLESSEGRGMSFRVTAKLAELQREFQYVSQASFAEMRKLVERIEREATVVLQPSHMPGTPANDVAAPSKDRGKQRVARKLPADPKKLRRDR